MNKRKYTKTVRAEKQEQTRERILEAVVALHEEVGPANTTVKAVAERAGVQRLTVYRHFPDDTSMFQACTSHWLASHQPPHEADWANIEDPVERCAAALLAFYRYYRDTEAMWNSSYKDVEKVSALQQPMAEFEAYLDLVRDSLLKSFKLSGEAKKSLKLTLRHGLRFSTWRSFKTENLKDEKIADLVVSWIGCLLKS